MVKRPSIISSGLQLELLEDRTLLTTEFPWLDAAVDTDSNFQFDFVWFPSDSQITLKGNNTGSLVINVDYLPNNVKNVAASSFTDVSLVGTRGIDRLFAVDLDNLHVDIPVHRSLITEDVEVMGLVDPAPFMLLEGGNTFFEAEDFSETFLYSDLDSLELQINDPESTFWLLSLNPDQTVRTNFVPNDFIVIGLEDSQLGLLGDEPSVQNGVNSLLAEFRVFDSQELESYRSNLDSHEDIIAYPNAIAEDSNITESESFELPSALNEFDSEIIDDSATARDENLKVADERISEEALNTYFLENFYNSGVWLPHQLVADNREPVYEIDYDSTAGDLFTPLEMDYSFVIESPLSEEVKEQEITPDEPTWLEKVELRMNELLARSNNTRLSLGEHLIMRAANEFTPGERPGLIVDTKAPSRNNFNHPETS